MAKEKFKTATATTPAGTAAYAWVGKPDEKFPKNGKPVYKINVVVDEDSDGLAALEAKCLEIAKDRWPDVKPATIRMPFGADDKDREEFAGKSIIKLTSVQKPKQVDSTKRALPEGVNAWSGDLVKAAGLLFTYESVEKVRENGKLKNVTSRGVSFQLWGVQLLDKRNAGSGDVGGLFDEEDGYVAPEATEETAGEDADDSGGNF